MSLDREEPTGDEFFSNDVWDELAKAREGLEPAVVQDFRTLLRGGQWTQGAKGVAYDTFQGQARQGGEVMAWCDQYHLQKSSSYAIATYGMDGARVLCQEWCRKLQYFLTSGSQQVGESTSTPTRRSMALLRVRSIGSW